MQRVSFDFMTRRLKQMAMEFFVYRKRQTKKEGAQDRSKTDKAHRIKGESRVGPGIIRTFRNQLFTGVESRQVRNRRIRLEAFADITRKYSERRSVRRGMAFDLVRNQRAKLRRKVERACARLNKNGR